MPDRVSAVTSPESSADTRSAAGGRRVPPVRVPHLVALAGLLLLLAAGPLSAVTVNTLYDASIPVADSSDEARNRATTQAMRVVLVKLTGNRRAPMTAEAQAIIENSERFVEQYQVVRRPDAELSTADGVDTVLEVRFNARSLDAAVIDAGLSRWSNERPEVLAWLFVLTDETWTPVAPGSVEQLRRLVATRARDRGLPLRWPNYDFKDTEALNSESVGGDSFGAVVNASERYLSNAVLYGTLSEATPEIWEADWRLRIGDEEIAWQGQSGFPELLLEEAVDAVADAMAARYATNLPAGSAEGIEVVVAGVQLADDYARVLRYFEEIDAIENVAVELVSGDLVKFSLQVRGGVPEFDRLVALGRTLQPVADSPGRYLVLH